MEVVLVLRSLPGSEVPEECRLRRLLKAALRKYGFRCLSVSPHPCPRGAQDIDPGNPTSDLPGLTAPQTSAESRNVSQGRKRPPTQSLVQSGLFDLDTHL